LETVEDIPNDRPCGRGNNADGPWKKRKRFFATQIKQSLRPEFLLPLLQKFQQRPLPCKGHTLYDQLILGTLGIGGHPSKTNHLCTFHELGAIAHGLGTPAHSVQGCTVILEGEVKVTRGVSFRSGDFPANLQMRKTFFHTLFQELRQSRHRENGAG
jgi:hypothetical protein